MLKSSYFTKSILLYKRATQMQNKFSNTHANWYFWATRNINYQYMLNYILINNELYLENQRYNSALRPLNIVGLMLNNKVNGVKPSAVVSYPNNYCRNVARKAHAISACYRKSNQSSHLYAGVGMRTALDLESHYLMGEQTPPRQYTPPADSKGEWTRLVKESLEVLNGLACSKKQAVYIRAYIKYMHLWGNTPLTENPLKLGYRGLDNEVAKAILLSI